MSAPIKPDADVSHNVLCTDFRREADQRYSNGSSMRLKSGRRQRLKRFSVNLSWSAVPDRSRPESGSAFGHGALPRNAPVPFHLDRALLRNACLRPDGPFRRRRHATRTISSVPGALKRLMRAMRIWIPAACRPGSLEATRSPKAVRPRIFASIRLRTWGPVHPLPFR